VGAGRVRVEADVAGMTQIPAIICGVNILLTFGYMVWIRTLPEAVRMCKFCVILRGMCSEREQRLRKSVRFPSCVDRRSRLLKKFRRFSGSFFARRCVVRLASICLILTTHISRYVKPASLARSTD
jgi:hypothetical protein